MTMLCYYQIVFFPQSNLCAFFHFFFVDCMQSEGVPSNGVFYLAVRRRAMSLLASGYEAGKFVYHERIWWFDNIQLHPMVM